MFEISREDYLKGTLDQLRKLRNEKKRYYFESNGKKFIGFPNVFSPKYFNDSAFFSKTIPIRKGEDFLEIGSGTGINSVFAALKGAKVVATDINLEAIKNTKENAKLHNLKIDTRFGSVFGPIKKGEKFDTIFWNVPFYYMKKEKMDLLEVSVFNNNYNTIKEFILNLSKYLKPKGRALIGFSEEMGRLDIIKTYCKKANLSIRLFKKKKTTHLNGRPITFQIFEIK